MSQSEETISTASGIYNKEIEIDKNLSRKKIVSF